MNMLSILKVKQIRIMELFATKGQDVPTQREELHDGSSCVALSVHIRRQKRTRKSA